MQILHDPGHLDQFLHGWSTQLMTRASMPAELSADLQHEIAECKNDSLEILQKTIEHPTPSLLTTDIERSLGQGAIHTIDICHSGNNPTLTKHVIDRLSKIISRHQPLIVTSDDEPPVEPGLIEKQT